MPLTIIKGPPNSGRTDELERLYRRQMHLRPVLVVPGVDDIFEWERRLTRETGAMLGGQIVHFRDLYGEVLRSADEPRPQLASELSRLSLIRTAIGSEASELAKLLPDKPGLVRAVLDLVDGFQADGRDPETIGERVNTPALRHLGKYALVYRSYLDGLNKLHQTDAAGLARAALRAVTAGWGNRPVMFAGFDEMTGQQLEMVRRLAFTCGADVTVAVAFELNNPAMKLTARLVLELENLGPVSEIKSIETERPESLPHAPVLLKMQREFLRPGSQGTIDAEEDRGAFLTLRSAGARNEAEAIGGEIARLLAGDSEAEPLEPGDIAIAVEAPAQNGTLIRDALREFGIPVSLEAETPANATVVGKAILQLLAAAGKSGTAENLIALLRAPGGPDPAVIDLLELHCKVNEVLTSADAVAAAQAAGISPEDVTEIRSPGLDRLVQGEDACEIVPAVARRIAAAILDSDPDPVPTSETLIEVRTAEAIAAACGEIQGIETPENRPQSIADAIAMGLVKVWAVPDQGTVRIASPYSLRAKRFKHLFYAGLQEASFTDTDRVGPFLSRDDLDSLGLSARRDPEDQQRYLFYSCLTVPTRGLCLSCRISDETGSPEHPSPLVKAAEELFVADQDGPVVRRGGRLGSDSVFNPAAAPTETELARSLRGRPAAGAAIPGIDPDVAARIDQRIEAGQRARETNRGFGNLTSDFILERWANQPVYGATDLEAYSRCEYRWFVERQLNPLNFGPEPDYFAFGNLVHRVLEALFEGGIEDHKMPQGGSIPSGWIELVPELVKEKASERQIRLHTNSLSHSSARWMATRQIELFLKRQSFTEAFFTPALLEAKFGTRDATIEAVPMGGWSLKGKVDRIDLSGQDAPQGTARKALVIDYKTGAVNSDYGKDKVATKRKLQIQLYMRAIANLGEELGLGVITPVAGIYQPVRLAFEKSRGAFECEHDAEDKSGNPVEVDLSSRGIVSGDRVESIEAFIEQGVEFANRAAEGISEGCLEHEPGSCPDHLDSPIVRERAIGTSEASGTY